MNWVCRRYTKDQIDHISEVSVEYIDPHYTTTQDCYALFDNTIYFGIESTEPVSIRINQTGQYTEISKDKFGRWILPIEKGTLGLFDIQIGTDTLYFETKSFVLSEAQLNHMLGDIVDLVDFIDHAFATSNSTTELDRIETYQSILETIEQILHKPKSVLTKIQATGSLGEITPTEDTVISYIQNGFSVENLTGTKSTPSYDCPENNTVGCILERVRNELSKDIKRLIRIVQQVHHEMTWLANSKDDNDKQYRLEHAKQIAPLEDYRQRYEVLLLLADRLWQRFTTLNIAAPLQISMHPSMFLLPMYARVLQLFTELFSNNHEPIDIIPPDLSYSSMMHADEIAILYERWCGLVLLKTLLDMPAFDKTLETLTWRDELLKVSNGVIRFSLTHTTGFTLTMQFHSQREEELNGRIRKPDYVLIIHDSRDNRTFEMVFDAKFKQYHGLANGLSDLLCMYMPDSMADANRILECNVGKITHPPFEGRDYGRKYSRNVYILHPSTNLDIEKQSRESRYWRHRSYIATQVSDNAHNIGLLYCAPRYSSSPDRNDLLTELSLVLRNQILMRCYSERPRYNDMSKIQGMCINCGTISDRNHESGRSPYSQYIHCACKLYTTFLRCWKCREPLFKYGYLWTQHLLENQGSGYNCTCPFCKADVNGKHVSQIVIGPIKLQGIKTIQHTSFNNDDLPF